MQIKQLFFKYLMDREMLIHWFQKYNYKEYGVIVLNIILFIVISREGSNSLEDLSLIECGRFSLFLRVLPGMNVNKAIISQKDVIDAHNPHLQNCLKLNKELNLEKTEFQKQVENQQKRTNQHSSDYLFTDDSICKVNKGRIKPIEPALSVKQTIPDNPIKDVARIGYDTNIQAYKYKNTAEKHRIENIILKKVQNGEIIENNDKNTLDNFSNPRFLTIDLKSQNDKFLNSNPEAKATLVNMSASIYDKTNPPISFPYQIGQTYSVLFTENGLSKQQSDTIQLQLSTFKQAIYENPNLRLQEKTLMIARIDKIITVHETLKQSPTTPFLSSTNSLEGNILINALHTINNSLFNAKGTFKTRLIHGTSNTLTKHNEEFIYDHMKNTNCISNISNQTYHLAGLDYPKNNVIPFLDDT